MKYWSRAGLMLTDWCNAACACCYANCSPAGSTWLSTDQALAIWADLIAASAHGCRVHLTGGEVFGRFDDLIDLCTQAQRRALGPLEAVETNGFWATDPATVRSRVEALDGVGVERLTVSADPYHQQYVPIERPRLLVRVAEEVLGSDRVRVRWRRWLDEGRDTDSMSPDDRGAFFRAYASEGADRFTGRAADGLDGEIVLKPAAEFDDKPCRERILRGRHVHIAPSGDIWPATCIGIVVGNALDDGVARTWDRLYRQWNKMPLIEVLSRRGPGGLLDEARRVGFEPRPAGYAGKCQLCFHLRRYLHGAGLGDGCLGPAGVYPTAPTGCDG